MVDGRDDRETLANLHTNALYEIRRVSSMQTNRNQVYFARYRPHRNFTKAIAGAKLAVCNFYSTPMK